MIDDAAEAYFGSDMGIFKKMGLDVEIMPFTNGAAIAAAVATGALDVGFSNLVSVANAIGKGVPLSILAPAALHLSDASTSGLLVSKDAPLATAKSLDGKTIAVNGLKNITQLSAQAWIDKHGGDSATVKFIEMPMPQMPVALREKRIDAAVAALSIDPTIGTAAAQERVLGDAYDGIGPRYLVTAYFSSKDWVAKNPVAARNFALAMRETAIWANANHEKSALILAKYSKMPIDLIRHVTRATYAEILDPKLIQPLIDSAVAYKMVSKPLAAEDLISTAALKQ